MQSREHKLVITEKVLSRITSRDPGRLCMVMLTEAGFSNASVTAHCWLNELLEAGTEYLMSLAWCEQLLWQEKGLLSSVEALNNSSPVQKDPPCCRPSTAPQHLGKVCGGLVDCAFAKVQVPLLKHICTCGFQAAAWQFLQFAALQFAALQLRLCALHAVPIVRAKSFVLPLFPISRHAREKKSHWKPNHFLRWNQDLKLSQVLAFQASVLSGAQAQCFVTQVQAMAAQVQLKTIQERVDFTAWSHCLGAAFYFQAWWLAFCWSYTFSEYTFVKKHHKVNSHMRMQDVQ